MQELLLAVPRPTIFTAKCAENHPRGEKDLCTMI